MDQNDRSIVGFAMIGHSMFHVYELAVPLFIVVWLDAFAVSEAVLGTVVGGSYALIGVGALLSGILADSYGSKTLVMLSLAGMAGGFGLVSVAPTIEVLAVALLVWGAGASLYHPAGLSLLTRGAKQRGTALAYHGVAGNVGTALGPFAAAILLTFLDWRLVAAVFVVPAIVGLLLVFRVDFDETAAVDADAESRADGGDIESLRGLYSQSRLLFTGGFLVAFAVMLLHGIYSRGVLSFLPEILADLQAFDPVVLFEESFEPSQYVYAGLLLLGGVGQYVGGKWTDRDSTNLALIVAYCAIVATSVLFLPAANAGVFSLLVVCGALGFLIYMTAPIRQALIAEYAASDVHGLSFGYTYLGVYGFGAIGASLAGIVLTYTTTEAFFLVFATFAAAVALLGGLLRYKFDR